MWLAFGVSCYTGWLVIVAGIALTHPLGLPSSAPAPSRQAIRVCNQTHLALPCLGDERGSRPCWLVRNHSHILVVIRSRQHGTDTYTTDPDDAGHMRRRQATATNDLQPPTTSVISIIKQPRPRPDEAVFATLPLDGITAASNTLSPARQRPCRAPKPRSLSRQGGQRK